MKVCPVFIDETGILSGPISRQPIYGIGALVVPDTRKITDSLYRLHFNFVSSRSTERNELRRNIRERATPPTLSEIDYLMRSTRHHEYKFTDITRFNLQQHIDILNLYFSFPNLEFHALVLDKHDPGFGLGKWGYDEWKAYASFAKELLKRSLNRDVFAIVDLQDKPNKSPEYLEDVLCSVESVQGCLRATSDMSIYLQIVDVLLGCVQFDLKDQRNYYGTTSRRAQEKREVVNFVKSRLGISPEERFLPSGCSFKQWETSHIFKVWKGEW